MRMQRLPSDIVIEHRLDKVTNANRFFVNALDYILGGFISFATLRELCEWIDRHDYRYVVGSRAHWRLP